jgi:hypothetical protein
LLSRDWSGRPNQALDGLRTWYCGKCPSADSLAHDICNVEQSRGNRVFAFEDAPIDVNWIGRLARLWRERNNRAGPT